MSEIMDDIRKLEQEISNSKILISKRDAAMRLAENKDFRELVLQDYFVTEAARLVQISGDAGHMDKEAREDALAMAQATGHTKRYFSMLVQSGKHAADSLQENEKELEILRAEAADEGDSERVEAVVSTSDEDAE